MIKSFITNPKKLFLMDALGAMISAVLLGIVLVKLEDVFGIPRKTLYFLAGLPILFTVYDLICLTKDKSNVGPFLKVIGIVNIVYCCISIGTTVYHFKTITIFGYLYIIIEVIITFSLALFEYKIGNKVSKRNSEKQN